MAQSKLSSRLSLPQVTLCAASSVNVDATLRALEFCLEQVDFAQCIIFSDQKIKVLHRRIDLINIPRIKSSKEYTAFVLHRMTDYIDSPFCMIAQWDGHLLDASKWQPEFLEYDFIGASWPQFSDGRDVGNGGFSLRSRRLMHACRSPEFQYSPAEDLAIGRVNHDWLLQQGMSVAPRALADMFSAERAGDPLNSFGYHGVWHMPKVLGVETFWDIYCDLDDRGTIRHDFGKILLELWLGPHGWLRCLKLISDQIVGAIADRLWRMARALRLKGRKA